MNIKGLAVGVVATFAVVLVVAVVVTYLWNLLMHSAGNVDWETSFRLAVILGIALPAAEALRLKQKQV